MNKGKVYIVGAGPGDEGLITVKGLDVIAEADVILCDELANSSLLKNAKSEAELLYVGKKAGNHALPQEKIENLLIEHAKSGKVVCRLKGGDPFVFGRGGEEALTLSENGIPYEIVSGVTSAIAAATNAGIPVTQRGISSGISIFTGHEDPKKEGSDLNWKSIARLKSTLVFLMGMKNLPSIVDQLIKNGMDSKTPAAVVHRGTTPKQFTVVGKLCNIVENVNRAEITAPSIIVIGNVVKMRDKLSWFEKKPLFGKQILVTRSRKQSSSLVKQLRGFGADVYEFPTIEIEPNPDVMSELDESIREISNYDWIIFTSANGVETFFERVLKLGLDARILKDVKISVIGTATRDKLSEYSIKTDLMPENYIAEAVLEAFKGKVQGKKILLPRADLARDVLPDGLKKEGAEVKTIDIYRTKVPSACGCELKDILDKVDIVTFASSSTVENFAAILGDNFENYKSKLKAVSIGPITSETLKKHGIEIVSEAREFNVTGLADAVLKYYDAKFPPLPALSEVEGKKGD